MSKPLPGENKVRFGCGFIFGFIFGGISLAGVFYESGNQLAIAAVLFGVGCGLAAMRYGDAFWHRIKNNGWWWS